LLSAEHHAGVRHHVVLSIVCVDRVQGNAHYAGKREQERLALAGPEPQDLVDMARRTLAARGESLRLIPSWRGPLGVEMAGEVLLPGPDAQIAPTTFEAWLAAQA
jgi:hypothetical protein